MTALYKIVSNFENSTNLSLFWAIIWVIENEFQRSSSGVLIGQYAETETGELQHRDLIEQVLYQTSVEAKVKYLLGANNTYNNRYKNYSFVSGLTSEENFNRSFGKKSKGIFFIDGMKSFGLLEADLLNEGLHYKRNGKFCIVYTGNQTSVMQTMEKMFQRLFKIYVINVNLLLRTGRRTLIYTYLPFTKTKKCHNAEPIPHGIVASATNYKYKKPNFFLKKLTNMWGCPLRITTWTESPFVILKKSNISGIEGLLLHELAKRKNFSIRLKNLPREDEGQNITYESPQGFLKMLVEKETNITIGALMYDKRRLQFADAAYNYLNVPMVLAIPRGQRMSPWERIQRPFKYIIWSCLSSSIIMGVIVVYFLKYFFKPYVHRFVFGRGVRTPFTNLWNVLYGGPIHGPLPTRNFARYILAVWIIYTWVLRSAYIGELFILLQDSRARSYLKTVSEVLKNNLYFFSYPLLEPLLLDLLVPKGNIKFFNQFPKLLKSLRSENSKFVVTLLGPVVREYNKQKQNQAHQINVLPEYLVMAPITFYMPKHSYLTIEFDDMLLKMMSAGLIEKFMEVYVGVNTLWVKTEKVEPVELSLWLLLGLFSIYLMLMVLCTMVFLFELISRRCILMRRIIDFLNY